MKLRIKTLDFLKNEIHPKETTLQRRLILFFIIIACIAILSFALLLFLFGINGKEEKAVNNYFDSELAHISEALYEDCGLLSLAGIDMAEKITDTCDDFFDSQKVSASQLKNNSALIEPLLAKQVQTLLNTMNSHSCGGVYILLDATVNSGAENAENMKSGIFLKKTQPVYTQAVNSKSYYLRGPAQIARDNGIELMGQWAMEYDISDEQFFLDVMETARENASLPLSRLYYWSGRVLLKGNSEAGFLQCVPLRSSDGTVFGVCGIEISDRLFKQCYSPSESNYQNLFTAVSPSDDSTLFTSKGMLAGNFYLTDNRMTDDLTLQSDKSGFFHFSGSPENYYGKYCSLRLYPTNSPYEKDSWSVAIMMPGDLFADAINGNTKLLYIIILAVLLACIIISVHISRRYLRPVENALNSIKENSYGENRDTTYTEIADLFDFLAQKDKEYEEQRLESEQKRREAQSSADNAMAELSRLTEKKRKEVDPDDYTMFCENLRTLTAKEREIFELYLDNKSAKDIMELLSISENTLKYHNRNIYSKLGVASRKELLMYATISSQKQKNNI